MTPKELVKLARARQYGESGEGRRLRQAAALSLREVALCCLDEYGRPVTPVTVFRWERGERAPRGAAGVGYCSLLDELRSAEKTPA